MAEIEKVLQLGVTKEANYGAVNTKFDAIAKEIDSIQQTIENLPAQDTNTTYTLEQDSTDGHKLYLKDNNGNRGATITVPDNNTDTKVTSVGNHYTPAADSSAELNADASGATAAAAWNTTNLVTGVNLERDAKGHVVGVTVDSIKMPANPNTDTNTAHTHAAGAGLVLADSNKGGISGVVTYKAKLKSETALGGEAGTGKLYPVAVDADGYLAVNVPWTDSNTTYSAADGIKIESNVIKHTNKVTAGTAQGSATKELAFGDTFDIPKVTYDAQGHITSKGTTTMTLPAAPSIPSLSGGAAATADATIVGGVTVSGHTVAVAKKTIKGASGITVSGDAESITITGPTIPSITVNGTAPSVGEGEIAVLTSLTPSGHTLTKVYGKAATKKYVDDQIKDKVAGAVKYLGTVASVEELSAMAANVDSKGDFVRATAQFTLPAGTAPDTGTTGIAEVVHVGDILVALAIAPAATKAGWDVGHLEIDTDTWKLNTKIADGYVAKGQGHANKVWKTDADGNPAWRDDADTDTGMTSVTVTGSGNAVTAASYDVITRKLTLTKGSTFLTSTGINFYEVSIDLTAGATYTGTAYAGKYIFPIGLYKDGKQLDVAIDVVSNAINIKSDVAITGAVLKYIVSDTAKTSA